MESYLGPVTPPSSGALLLGRSTPLVNAGARRTHGRLTPPGTGAGHTSFSPALYLPRASYCKTLGR